MPHPGLTRHAVERWRDRFGGTDASLHQAIREARTLTRGERDLAGLRPSTRGLAHDQSGALFLIDADRRDPSRERVITVLVLAAALEPKTPRKYVWVRGRRLPAGRKRMR